MSETVYVTRQSVDFEFPTTMEAQEALNMMADDIVAEDVTTIMHLNVQYNKPMISVRTEIFANPSEFFNWVNDTEEAFEQVHGAFKRCNFFVEAKTVLESSVVARPKEEEGYLMALPAAIVDENNSFTS